MAVRDVFYMGGQSNSGGASAGETGSDLATVPFWKDEVSVTVTPALGSLLGAAGGGTGCAYTFGRLLLTAGFRPIIWNIYRGSTAANAWAPGGAYYDELVASLEAALAATQSAHSGDTFRFHMLWDQGEYEARYGYPSPSGPEQAIIDAWPTNVGLVREAFEDVVGASASLIIVGTNYQLDDQNNAAAFRVLQQAAGHDMFVTRDEADGVTYAGTDGLHPNTAGYVQYGERLAPAVAAYLAGLGSLSVDTRDAMIDHLRDKAALTPAATHYVHLYEGANWTTPLTDATAADYAPASNTNDDTTWPDAADRAKSNGVAFEFPTPGGTWVAFRSWRLTDSAVEGVGTVLMQGSHNPIVATVATGAWSYPAGGISIVAATGGFSDAVVHGLFDRIFGGAAFAQNTTQYPSHWAGDPQGAGSQAGSRVAVTQASTWGSASGGVAVTVAPISLTQQVTGTYLAEHAASTGGTPLLSAARPAAVGASGTIAAGELKTQIL